MYSVHMYCSIACTVLSASLLSVLFAIMCIWSWHYSFMYQLQHLLYVYAGINLYTECMQLICCNHKRGIPTETTNQNGVPQNLSCVVVLLHCARDYR